MYRRFLWFSLSLTWILMFGCNQGTKESTLLVGTNRVIDRNIPYPFLLEREGDSIFLIDHKNKIIDKGLFGNASIKFRDTLKMREHSFLYFSENPEYYLFDLKDSLNFPYRHIITGAKFRYTFKKELPPLEVVREQLLENPFTANVELVIPNTDLDIKKTWRFSKDSLTSVFSYYYADELVYQEKQTKKYYLFERQGSVFFSENEVAENPQMLYQLTSFNEESFKILYYRYGNKIEEVYEMAKGEKNPDNLPVYAQCQGGEPGEYYHDNVTYVKGNDYLVERIKENAPLAEGNGYITVHFAINCEGKVGRLGLEQMDRDYKASSFSPALVKHIVSEVAQLEDWPEVPPSYFYKDVHAFLMFKIRNGKITDLCP